MLQILLKYLAKNEIAMTVPSISLTPRWTGALLHSRWQRRLCLSYHKIEKTRGLCLGRKVAPPAFQNLSATQCHLHFSHYDHVVKTTRSLLWLFMDVVENFRNRSCIYFGHVCVKRSFSMRKGKRFLNAQALQQCPYEVLSALASSGCPLVWFLNGTAQDPGAVLQKIIFWG